MLVEVLVFLAKGMLFLGIFGAIVILTGSIAKKNMQISILIFAATAIISVVIATTQHNWEYAFWCIFFLSAELCGFGYKFE